MTRNAWAMSVATIAVIAVIILGFRVFGSPRTQRLIKSDVRTLRVLQSLAEKIKASRDIIPSQVLPASLDQFPESEKKNPVTNKFFTYHPKTGAAYELCTTFAAASPDFEPGDTQVNWAHPKGDFCFQLNASQNVPPIPYVYY
jgi:hypothetical protein